MSLIFVMIDGVGLAPAGPFNPVAAGLPQLAGLLDQPLTGELHVDRSELYAAPIDATMGVAGLPQSGSGHTAIYGGFNAAVFNGRHQPSFPTVPMRERLADDNLLLRAVRRDRRVAWANVYLPGYLEAIAARRTRHTAGTWAALQIDQPLRSLDDLVAGKALSWDITQRMAREHPRVTGLPQIDAAEAGARLVDLAADHDLVLFETYLPDLAGHGRIPWSVPEALDAVDGLIAGVAQHLRNGDTLVLTSDHGNSEDSSVRTHTRNPVPLIAIGQDAAAFRGVSAIEQLAAVMLDVIGGRDA